MSLIRISNLTFAYEGSCDTVFDRASVQIDTDWRLGLIGRNGRGKTTLLRLLAGELPHEGQISASTAFTYFPFPIKEPQRALHAVLKELSPEAQEWEVLRELSLLEVEEAALERPFAALSGGEQVKALLAALFLRPGEYLLIDEPTNHLDLAARERISAYLRRKSGFLLVSHDRQFLDGCVDHILAIRQTGFEVQRGNFSSWQTNKQRQDAWELAENEKLKKEIRRLDAAAKRTADWSDRTEKGKKGERNSGLRPDRGFVGHKAAKMMQRSKNIEDRRTAAIEEKSALLHDVETAESLKLFAEHYPYGRLVEAKGISISYGGKAVFEEVSFSITDGERVALLGRNGAGKSSLLRLILGEKVPYNGMLRLGSGLRLSYVAQDTSFLKGELRSFARESGIDETRFKTILRKLDFSREQLEKDMAQFSGGQKKKVLIARSLCQKAHLYLWDEPLNFIDVFSRQQIEKMIEGFAPTMLLVEHDRAFLDRVATKVVELKRPVC